MEITKQNKIEFAKVMYGLAGNFGGEVSRDDLALRFEVLKEYSLDEIKQAGIWLLKKRDRTFPAVPTTKEIIDVIEYANNPQLTPKAKAHEQCDIVLKYFNHYGSACDHTFKDPSTKYLMENRWSLYQLGRMNESDLRWWRKNFVESYLDISKPKDVELLENKDTENCEIPVTDLKLLTKIGA
jgi:hypothetical protein